MHLAQPVADAGVKQDSLGTWCLAGVDVGHEPYVAMPRQGDLASHAINPNPSSPKSGLPPVMRERLVGVGHAVGVFFLFYGAAAPLGGVHQLRGPAAEPWISRPGTAKPIIQRMARAWRDRSLSLQAPGRWNHPPGGFDLDHGPYVVHGLFEHPERILAGAVLYGVMALYMIRWAMDRLPSNISY